MQEIGKAQKKTSSNPIQNVDFKTVVGFGEEWTTFDQRQLSVEEWQRLFESYFSIFPWKDLPPNAEGFDLGCGSGRWAAGVAHRVGQLHCIDPSEKALAVARTRLGTFGNVRFHSASVDAIPLPDASQDFAYSLGVLHHVPDTYEGIRSCVAKLKPGAPLLIYLYYAFDNRPWWYRSLWRFSDLFRKGICSLPFPLKKIITTVMAGLVYWPFSRLALLVNKNSIDVSTFPLSFYRNCSFYTMRTDALDRFGTRLEQRFTRKEIQSMMHRAGLENITFREAEPFWIACGRKFSVASP